MRSREKSVDPSAQIDQLREALSTQPVIEQAKGMLMLVRGWTAAEAFDALREISQHTNIKLHDVAGIIVASGSREQPPLPDRDTVQAVLAEIRRSVLGESIG
ncbi:ANTAR domain-containing protein [Saccharothrix hoggarensis]|uniref:ANTAR domain-containing protein n=1 Tax=Saccharothrix hoggarensis TaxID=913853 RepID=A0ABW3R0R2_9PSEU